MSLKIITITGVMFSCLMSSPSLFAREDTSSFQFPENSIAESFVMDFANRRYKNNPELPLLERLTKHEDFLIPTPLRISFDHEDMLPHFEFPIGHRTGVYSVMGQVSKVVSKGASKTLFIDDFEYPVSSVNRVYEQSDKKGFSKSYSINVEKGTWVLLGFDLKSMKVIRIITLDESSLKLSISIHIEETKSHNSDPN